MRTGPNMIIFSFVEGAWPIEGGVGIGCVPEIGLSIAANGSGSIIFTGGNPTPGYGEFVVSDWDAAARRAASDTGFSILSLPSFSKYNISLAMLWSAVCNGSKADIIILHSLYSFPVLVGYVCARIYGKPYVLYSHGVLAPFQRKVSRIRKALYNWVVANDILRRSSALICTAVGEWEELGELRASVRGALVPHGIDLAAYESLPPRGRFRDSYLQGHTGPLLLSLGRLAGKKNLELMLASFAVVLRDFPDAKLAMVGPADPPAYQAQIESWVKEYGVADSVVLPGAIRGIEGKKEAFVDADLFLVSSFEENFCHSLFEAMACGLPSVVTNTINYAFEVEQRETGLIVSATVPAFAEGTVQLLRDKERRSHMSKNCRSVTNDYSWQKCGERLVRLCTSLARGEGIPADLAVEVASGRGVHRVAQ